MTGDATNPTFIRTSTAFHQDPLGSANAHGINAMVIDAFPELAYDSWVTVGLDQHGRRGRRRRGGDPRRG